MMNNHDSFNVPVLKGAVESQKLKGIYFMRDKAEVGKVYLMECPACHKASMVKAKDPKPFICTCNYCKTKAVVVGYQTAAQQPQNASPLQDKKDNSYQEPQPTEKIRIHGENTQTSGRLVWGSFLRRKSYILHEGANYIGRNDSEILSDVTIDDEYVSRRSILIEVTPAAKGYTYKLTVKKCTNPVLINGKELQVGNSIYLNYGDTILVGNTTLTFKPAK